MKAHEILHPQLLDAVCRRGVLVSTHIRYWRGCKKLKAEDLGLDPDRVSDRLIQLGQKRLVPRDALSGFTLLESRTHAMVEASSFPFLGGIARFVPNALLAEVVRKLNELREDFRDETLSFVGGYGPLRDQAMAEWTEAAGQLGGRSDLLLATIGQSFPAADSIAARFGFEFRLFQVSVPEGLGLEVVQSLEQMEVAEERRRLANDASRRLQSDLDAFIRESVARLREETVQLADDVLATIQGAENGVHQRTLNRLTSFIEQFRSMNFADDQQLETTLEQFRTRLLGHTAGHYRNHPSAMTDLTEGLSRLREAGGELARGDAREIVARFGRLGGRKLAHAG